MRTRHKPPSLVSMWMLDVFCCALGCVTLLWLLSTRDAKDEAARNRTAVDRLVRTENDLRTARDAAADDARRAAATVADLQARLSAAGRDRDATAAALAAANGDLSAARAKLAQTTADRARLAAKVDEQTAAAAGLRVKLGEQTTAAAGLQAKLAQAQANADEAVKTLQAKDAERLAVAAKLTDAEKKLAAGARDLDSASKDKRATGDTLRQTRDELAAARATVIDLQGQKAKLADKLDKLRTDADAKFAGIALTGRRVVFVVDTSGSMKLVDEKTPAPDKWPTVVDTVGKVMRSLPELEKFQVVTFSRRADWLFPGGWQDYRGEPTVKAATDALRRVEPEGDTNVYDALDLAFRLKTAGLDTVYLFSDGLPTSGPGVGAEERTTATDKSDRLAKHVLRTLRADWNRPGAGRVRVNAVGFFFESPDVGAFLWALARDNDGSFVGMSRP